MTGRGLEDIPGKQSGARARRPRHGLLGAASLHHDLSGLQVRALSPWPFPLAPTDSGMLWEPLGRASTSFLGQQPLTQPGTGSQRP